MRKKSIAAVLALGLVLGNSVQVFASPSIDDQLNSAKTQYNQSQSNVTAAEKKYNDLTIQVQTLDNQISNNMSDIDTINSKITSVQSKISDTQKSISDAQNDISTQQYTYNQTMKSMYTNQSTAGYLGVLLDSKGVSDFVAKVQIIQKLQQYDENIISNLNARKAEVQSQKDQLEKDKASLTSLKTESQNKLTALNNQEATIKPLVAQAKAEQDAAIASSAALKTQVANLNAQSQKMKAEALAAAQAAAAQQATAKQTAAKQSAGSNNTSAPVISPAVSSSNASASALISYASQFIGIYYQWGGTTPSGFDCSGFVQYVYGHFGISLPRTTYDQINVGTPVTSLQPGDLVFFGSASSPHHVGIYIGGGKMLDSPQTGEQLGVHSLYGDYCAARRILK